MKLARLQVDEMAAPVLALVRDGAYYDVASLEEQWRSAEVGGDICSFHARVVAARCAGLGNLDARLSSGRRPSEARLRDEDVLLLPPCSAERAAYLQLSPFGASGPLRFERRDARALVGHAQPLLFPKQSTRPRCEVGLAALLGEELHHASERQAQQALIGITVVLDWTSRIDWSSPRWEPHAPSQLGPLLLAGASMRRALREPLRLVVGPQEHALSIPDDTAARLAALSRLVPLAPGDVVGLGRLPGVTLQVEFGQLIRASLSGAPALSGCALPFR